MYTNTAPEVTLQTLSSILVFGLFPFEKNKISKVRRLS